MISRCTDVRRALRSRQRGFLLNPYRFGGASGGGGSPADAASLLAKMVAWWSLDENAATATYADSHGSNPLTQRNGSGSVNTSVNSSVGGIRDRFWFPSNVDNLTCYIPRTNTALDGGNVDHSFGLWGQFGAGSFATTAYVMGRADVAGGNYHSYIDLLTTSKLRMVVFTPTGTGNGAAETTINANSTTWGLLVGTLNRTANTVEIRYRLIGGSLDKTVTAFTNAARTASSNTNFCIAETLNNNANFGTGNRSGVRYADEAFYLSGAITDTEFDYLFNAGAGRSYAELVADAA